MKTLLLTTCLAAVTCFAQDTPATDTPHGTSQMDMSSHDMDMSNMHSQDAAEDPDAAMRAMHSMEGHMDMGPHMKMTALRPLQPGDAERAQKVAEAARQAMEKYKDYRVALQDGFKIFHPEIPQKQYHFTNYRYGFEAAFNFNPDHPTSLLYEKSGDEYRLIGVMYTAPKRFTEDDLNGRIPLSIARWHEHVNFCKPPADRRQDLLSPHPKFGFRGSINTQAECEANGGKFIPIVFNWMVHVYPLEKDAAQMWSVERQHAD